MKKKLLIAGAAATLGLAGLGVTAYAATTDGGNGLVEAIASKFNLNKDEVQKVFDEQKSKMDAEREQRIKDELATLVKEGKLTQEQADKLIAKRAEMEKDREANRPDKDGKKPSEMTDAEREAKKKEMEAKKTELDTWLKEQGISAEYGRFLMGGRGGPGGHGMGDPGQRRGDTSDAQSTQRTQ